MKCSGTSCGNAKRHNHEGLGKRETISGTAQNVIANTTATLPVKDSSLGKKSRVHTNPL